MTDAPHAVQVANAEQVLQLAGREVGPTSWFEITQHDVDAFGSAVQDWHWAHNDPERAAGGPFGGPIAHAHMTLALAPHFRAELITFTSGECMFYGYDRVRFPAPVLVGARLRVHATVLQVDEVPGGEQLTIDLRFEIEGQERPACVARGIWRHYDLDPSSRPSDD